MDKSKTLFLNGIKGIACLAVFLHHFLLSFFPAIHFGLGTVSHMPYQLDIKLSQNPVSVFFNGNFMVCLFLLITAIIFTSKFIACKNNLDREIVSTMLKRYFRITIPVFLISVIVWVFNGFNLFKNAEISLLTGSSWLGNYYTTDLKFLDIILCSFAKVPFFGNNTFCTVFWMLKYVILGTYICILLGTMIRLLYQKAIFILVLLAIIFTFGNTYYLPVVLGALLVVLVKEKNNTNQYIGILSLIFGLFLGGYPSGVNPTNIYSCFNFLKSLQVDSMILCHSLGAFLVIYGIWQMDSIKAFLETKFFLGLGKISFSIYLIHILIIFSISVRVFRKLYFFTSMYFLSVVSTFFITVIILIFCSLLLNKIMEKYVNKINKLIVNFFVI